MRTALAGPVLRGQRFANEQILGPSAGSPKWACKWPVQACLQSTV